MKRNLLKIALTPLVALVIGVAAEAADLETDVAKLSYTFGMDIGNSLKSQDAEVDLEIVFEAIRTAYEGGESRMSAEEVKAFRAEFIARRQAVVEEERAAEGAKNQASAEAFAAQNRAKDGVVETASGLQYSVEQMGNGELPKATDSVTVHYRGTLQDGSEFDSSYARQEPISFGLSNVIPGWTEGLQLMPVGSKFTFYIPPDLAYGPDGRPPVIPPASLLIFEVELLNIDAATDSP